MPEPEARCDAYQAAREAALAWLTARWDPGITVRQWNHARTVTSRSGT
jgi:hypothetical protein